MKTLHNRIKNVRVFEGKTVWRKLLLKCSWAKAPDPFTTVKECVGKGVNQELVKKWTLNKKKTIRVENTFNQTNQKPKLVVFGRGVLGVPRWCCSFHFLKIKIKNQLGQGNGKGRMKAFGWGLSFKFKLEKLYWSECQTELQKQTRSFEEKFHCRYRKSL